MTTETLATCPRCGRGGFIDLARHVCRAEDGRSQGAGDQVARAGLDPEWDRARELHRKGRQLWRELCAEILRLRERYFAAGRNDTLKRGKVHPFRSTHDASNGEKSWLSRSTHDASNGEKGWLSRSTHDASNGEKGWRAKVTQELGISHDTAQRWLADLERERQIRLIAAGELEVVEEVRGRETIRHVVDDAVIDRARAAVEELDRDPTMRPARSWAGLWGGHKTAGKQRAPINHAWNIAKALTQLQTSLPHWAELQPAQRAAIEKGWDLIRDLLPTTFRR